MTTEKKSEIKPKMERDGDYFIKITHSVCVIYKGKKYEREECIINGQVSLFWKTWNEMDDDYETYNYVSSLKEVNELNEAYANMSYQENFKKEQ